MSCSSIDLKAYLLGETPERVYEQIEEFIIYAGGLGNLLSMGQAGFLSHEDTVDSMTLFGKEVLPRLKAFRQPGAEAAISDRAPGAQRRA